ncbi:Cell wall hydrolase, SleB [Rhabdaerophilaceae bacterium]
MQAYSSGAKRQRHKRIHLLVSMVASTAIVAAALISTIATAGVDSRVPDIEFRRTTMIEPSRVTITPPRLSPLLMIRAPDELDNRSGSIDEASIAAHVRRVDLKRNSADPHRPGEPLFFLDSPALLPSRALDPALTLTRAGALLMARLRHFEGRTPHRPREAGTSPVQGMSHADLTLTRPDGSTPGVSRAIALASVTPAPVEPEVIQAASMRLPSMARLHATPQPADTPPVAIALRLPTIDLSDPETRAREQKCLAEAVYFESRSEPVSGQAAVAQVVLNRARSGLYPTTICGVVYQNRHRYKACQFTFACEGKALVVNDSASWATATRVASEVLDGQTYLPAVGGSTHYHADYVSPWWSRKLKRTDRIGRHIFYTLRPGQT